MKKIVIVLLSVTFILACSVIAPPPTATPVPTVTPSPEPTFTATPTLPPTATATPALPKMIKVKILPFYGKLDEQLAAEAQKATELGMIPVIEFDATW
jgi:hypothetical protein